AFLPGAKNKFTPAELLALEHDMQSCRSQADFALVLARGDGRYRAGTSAKRLYSKAKKIRAKAKASHKAGKPPKEGGAPAAPPQRPSFYDKWERGDYVEVFWEDDNMYYNACIAAVYNCSPTFEEDCK
ncbi:hypothetical protein TeGR_g7758, partial [Tetraparma gracilis]